MRQKKNRKRAISLFLVLTMLASLIPSNFVMAAETHEEPEVLMEEVSEEPTTEEVSPDTTEEAPEEETTAEVSEESPTEEATEEPTEETTVDVFEIVTEDVVPEEPTEEATTLEEARSEEASTEEVSTEEATTGEDLVPLDEIVTEPVMMPVVDKNGNPIHMAVEGTVPETVISEITENAVYNEDGVLLLERQVFDQVSTAINDSESGVLECSNSIPGLGGKNIEYRTHGAATMSQPQIMVLHTKAGRYFTVYCINPGYAVNAGDTIEAHDFGDWDNYTKEQRVNVARFVGLYFAHYLNDFTKDGRSPRDYMADNATWSKGNWNHYFLVQMGIWYFLGGMDEDALRYNCDALGIDGGFDRFQRMRSQVEDFGKVPSFSALIKGDVSNDTIIRAGNEKNGRMRVAYTSTGEVQKAQYTVTDTNGVFHSMDYFPTSGWYVVYKTASGSVVRKNIQDLQGKVGLERSGDSLTLTLSGSFIRENKIGKKNPVYVEIEKNVGCTQSAGVGFLRNIAPVKNKDPHKQNVAFASSVNADPIFAALSAYPEIIQQTGVFDITFTKTDALTNHKLSGAAFDLYYLGDPSGAKKNAVYVSGETTVPVFTPDETTPIATTRSCRSDGADNGQVFFNCGTCNVAKLENGQKNAWYGTAFALLPGTYRITESAGRPGYTTTTGAGAPVSFTFTVTESNVRGKTVANPYHVPLTSTVPNLFNGSNEVSNKAKEFSLKVKKVDGNTNHPLKNVTFQLYAAEDIYYLDGDETASNKVFVKDQVIQTKDGVTEVATDGKGIATWKYVKAHVNTGTFSNITLMPGKYYVKETRTVGDYIVDTKKRPVTIRADQVESLLDDVALVVPNYKQLYGIKLTKQDSITRKPILNQSFTYALYAAEDIVYDTYSGSDAGNGFGSAHTGATYVYQFTKDKKIASKTVASDGIASFTVGNADCFTTVGSNTTVSTVKNQQLVPGKYYVKETVSCGDYVLCETKIPVTIKRSSHTSLDVIYTDVTAQDTPKNLSLQVKKVDEMTDQLLQGVSFDLYAAKDIAYPDGQMGTLFAKDSKLASATTDENGIATFTTGMIAEGNTALKNALGGSTWGLVAGDYYLLETVSAPNYFNEGVKIPVALQSDGSSIQTVYVNHAKVTNQATTYKIAVKKTDKDTGNTLTDVTFELYAKEDLSYVDGTTGVVFKKNQKIATATTGADGIAVFDKGTTSNPAFPTGDCTLVPGAYYVKETVTHKGYVLAEDTFDVTIVPDDTGLQEVTTALTVQDEQIQYHLQIIKSNAEGENTGHMKDLTLQGATFGIWPKEDIVSIDGAGTVIHPADPTCEGEPLMIVTTDAAGHATFDEGLFYGVYAVKELTPPLTKDAIEHPEKYPDEHDPARYAFEVNPAIFEVVLKNDGTTVTDPITVEQLGVTDVPVKQPIEITKMMSENDGEKVYPLAKVGFSLYLESEVQDVFDVPDDLSTVTDEQWKSVEHLAVPLTEDGSAILLTGEDGKARSIDLVAGDYIVREVVHPAASDPIVPERLHLIAYANGTKLPEYKFSAFNYPFGQIKVHKTGDTIIGTKEIKTPFGPSYRMEFGKRALKGVEFTIYDKQGREVDTITTDSEGLAVSKRLNVGEYKIKETKAPAGMVISDKVWTLFVSYDTVTGLADVDLDIENDICDSEIKVYKLCKALEPSEDGPFSIIKKPMKDIYYGVFTAEAIKDQNGTEILGADSLVAVSKTAEDGIACIRQSLVAGKYYYKELRCLPGYIIDKNTYPFELKLGNKEVTSVEVNKEDPRMNHFNNTAKVRLYKTNGDGSKRLASAEFTLYSADNDQKLGVYYTDKDGVIAIDEMPCGNFYFRETKAPAGYVGTNQKISFTITEGSDVELKFTVKNNPTKRLGFNDSVTQWYEIVSYVILLLCILLGVKYLILYVKMRRGERIEKDEFEELLHQ